LRPSTSLTPDRKFIFGYIYHMGGNKMTPIQQLIARQKRRFGVLATAVILAAILVQPASAHTRIEVGPYAIVVGWLVEPAIVGERNALTVEITEDEAPVEGAEATLDVELVYGGQQFRVNLNPTEEAGLYTAELFPTVRGQYAVRLFGSLGDLAIDETIEPEEVFDASRIQFPEPQPDPRELQREITALESALQSARTLATIGIGVGAAGILLAAVSLIRRRQ
jgi:hypothetical protein